MEKIHKNGWKLPPTHYCQDLVSLDYHLFGFIQDQM